MNTTSKIVLTAGVVVIGRWTEDKKITIKIAIGAAFVALMLAVMDGADTKLASQMATLILVAASLRYGRSILNKAMLDK